MRCPIKPLGHPCRYASSLLAAAVAAGPAAAGSVDFVPYFETGSAWFDPVTGAADRAAVDSMLDQFETIIKTPGCWDASIEVFLHEGGTSSFASTGNANSADVFYNGSTYRATGTWREIVLGHSDDNGSIVDLDTGAGADTSIDWNFSLSSPASNIGLLRHELMHSLGMTSFLGNDMPTMAPDGTITGSPFTTTFSTVYDARIVDLNGNSVVGAYISEINYMLNDYVVDNDWDDSNVSGLAFLGIADDGSDLLLYLTSFPAPAGQNRTIQANHPEAVSYAFAHPTWFTIEEVDRALLRGMGYTVGTVASFVIRNGTGFNPLGYTQTTPAQTGSTWTTAVDIVTPGHPISVVAVSSLPGTAGIFPGGSIVGEFLVQLSGTLQLDFSNGTHQFPLPNDPSLIGVCIATQGATVSALGQAHLNNALDIVIGG